MKKVRSPRVAPTGSSIDRDARMATVTRTGDVWPRNDRLRPASVPGMDAMVATEYRAGDTRYRLVDADLVVDTSTGEGARRVALGSVRHVRLFVAQGRGFCVLTPKSGRTVMVTTPPRPEAGVCSAYAAFVRELHRRLAAAAPGAELVAGHGVFFVLHVICLAALAVYGGALVLALVSGVHVARLAPTLPSITLPLVFLASSSRGRPRRYSRGVVPPSFLPVC
jgi:hypothetical protein